MPSTLPPPRQLQRTPRQTQRMHRNPPPGCGTSIWKNRSWAVAKVAKTFGKSRRSPKLLARSATPQVGEFIDRAKSAYGGAENENQVEE